MSVGNTEFESECNSKNIGSKKFCFLISNIFEKRLLCVKIVGAFPHMHMAKKLSVKLKFGHLLRGKSSISKMELQTFIESSMVVVGRQ